MMFAFFACFFLLWELSIDWFEVPQYILNKPSEIIINSAADLPRLMQYTYITGLETVLGFVVAICLAIPIGVAITFSNILRRTLYPFLVSVEMVPKIAFAPLFISWLGLGMRLWTPSKLAAKMAKSNPVVAKYKLLPLFN